MNQMKTKGLFQKFVITVFVLFLICQIVFISIYSYPSQQAVYSYIPSENDTDIEDIKIEKQEKRKGKSGDFVYITDNSEKAKLKSYARIQHLEISNVDASTIQDISGLEVNNLILNNASQFDISNINCKRLKTLSITNTKVSNIQKLCDSPSFVSLTISGVDSENNDFLKGFKNLTYLSLSDIHFKDASFLKDMKNLEILYMENCGLSNITYVANLKNIKELNLCNNNIIDISVIKNFPELTYLSISQNKIQGTLDLSNCPKLLYADAQSNLINEFKLHKDISANIDLSYNNIKEIDINTINNMNSELRIDLFGNNLSDNPEIKNSKNITFTSKSTLELTYDEHRAYLNALNHFNNKYIRPEWSDIKKAAIAYIALSLNTKYLYDYKNTDLAETKYAHSEYGALVNKTAVCDGFSYAYSDILRRNGIESMVYYGDYDSTTDDETHAWNVFYIDSKPYHCDITQRVGKISEEIYYDTNKFFEDYMKFFGKSDKFLLDNKYTLDSKDAPKCPENISASAISNIIYEIVNGEELYLFVNKDDYNAKKSSYESDVRTEEKNE
ncbi:MAG: hypothetical protein E7396_01250 [Ruminococcaceae bacterium]|nr:hypothetical protein [Oscillospiraceae bacterium]